MTLTTDDVWSAFSAKLSDFIRARVNDPADADDVLQDVFLKIHRHLDSLEDESRLAPWVHQITRNAIIDFYRSRRYMVQLTDYVPADAVADDRDAERQLASGLQEAIESLPEQYREALLLAEIQGVAQKDLAGQLGLSYSGAKSRVQRGRRLLHEALIACCHIELDRRGGIIDYVPREALCRECCAT